jgi:hypothetical protein
MPSSAELLHPPVAAPGLPPGEVVSMDMDAPASTFAGSVAAEMSLLVAPTTGRFRPRAGLGLVGRGALIGVVTGGGGRVSEVRAPLAAEVCGLLAIDGQLVQAGQALAWIRRVGGQA